MCFLQALGNILQELACVALQPEGPETINEIVLCMAEPLLRLACRALAFRKAVPDTLFQPGVRTSGTASAHPKLHDCGLPAGGGRLPWTSWGLRSMPRLKIRSILPALKMQRAKWQAQAGADGQFVRRTAQRTPRQTAVPARWCGSGLGDVKANVLPSAVYCEPNNFAKD